MLKMIKGKRNKKLFFRKGNFTFFPGAVSYGGKEKYRKNKMVPGIACKAEKYAGKQNGKGFLAAQHKENRKQQISLCAGLRIEPYAGAERHIKMHGAKSPE